MGRQGAKVETEWPRERPTHRQRQMDRQRAFHPSPLATSERLAGAVMKRNEMIHRVVSCGINHPDLALWIAALGSRQKEVQELEAVLRKHGVAAGTN